MLMTSIILLEGLKKTGEELSTQTLGKEPFQRILHEDDLNLLGAPAKLFHPYRMLIMKTLTLHGNVEFRQLKHNIPQITDARAQITDGNLAGHLRVLEKSGYIHCHKEVVNRKLRTSYEITTKGRKAFEQLKTLLNNFTKEDDST